MGASSLFIMCLDISILFNLEKHKIVSESTIRYGNFTFHINPGFPRKIFDTRRRRKGDEILFQTKMGITRRCEGKHKYYNIYLTLSNILNVNKTGLDSRSCPNIYFDGNSIRVDDFICQL